MNTLDINYHFFEKPKEYLFFKKMGVSIFGDGPESNAPGRLLSGLFLSVKTVAGVKRVSVDTELSSGPLLSKGFLYSCTHSKEDIIKLKHTMDSDLEYRIYYFCHTFLDIRTEFKILQSLEIDISRITLLVSNYGQIPFLHTKKNAINLLQDCLYNETLVVNPYRQVQESVDKSNQKVTFGFNLFFLIRFFKVALMPVHFLKVQLDQLRVNNFIWLIRLDELLAFIFFVVSSVWFRLVGICIDTFNFLSRYLKIGLIKAGYGLRHLLLMSGFKSFGFFVDSYQLMRVLVIRFFFGSRHLVLMAGYKGTGICVDTFNFLFRHLKIGLIKIGYGLRHLLLMSGFKSFGFFVDLYHLVSEFFSNSYQLIRVLVIRFAFGSRHLFLMAGYKGTGICIDTFNFVFRHLKIGLIKIGYGLRHLFLMSTFKSYGLIVWIFVKTYYFVKDVVILKIIHQYLLFPFYKIYWFSNFQYKKRIKKEIL